MLFAREHKNVVNCSRNSYTSNCALNGIFVSIKESGSNSVTLRARRSLDDANAPW